MECTIADSLYFYSIKLSSLLCYSVTASGNYSGNSGNYNYVKCLRSCCFGGNCFFCGLNCGFGFSCSFRLSLCNCFRFGFSYSFRLCLSHCFRFGFSCCIYKYHLAEC